MIREITMRIARTAALAAVLHLAAAGCTSRPVAGASPGGSVTIPGGAPDGGDVTVSVAECTKCHGSAARVVALSTDAKGIEIAPPPDVAGLQTGGTKIGAHLAHLRATRWRASGVPCASCHVVPATAGAHLPGVLFRGLARAAWPGKPAIDPQYGASGSCSATYCHGNFTAGANLAMSWTDGPAPADCGTCHGIPPLATHAPSATNCATCHGGTYTSASVDPALHMNGQLDGGGESGGCWNWSITCVWITFGDSRRAGRYRLVRERRPSGSGCRCQATSCLGRCKDVSGRCLSLPRTWA